MYFDKCVKDQSLVFIFVISFLMGTLLTATILISCLKRQFNSIVQYIFFHFTTRIYEFVNVRQLNSSVNSILSRPGKAKFIKDVL